jgi:hypothetical protein
MKKIILFICLIGMTVFLTGCYTSDTSSNKKGQKVESELLYGKYPEPLVKGVAMNPDVNKNYKEVTMDDLKKVRNFHFVRQLDENYPDKEYGFKDNEEYDFSIILEMPNLTDLEIDLGPNIRLKDYSILKRIKGLQTLIIGNIGDSDIDNIIGLDSLNWLIISNSSITNIEFLKSLSQLTLFGLDKTPNVRNFKPLEYLTKVDQVNLTNSNFTENEIGTIPDIETLTCLSLYNNNIKKIEQLPQMENLEVLEISRNPLTGINIPATKLPDLKYLGLDDTDISDLKELKGVENIDTICLRRTKVKLLSPIRDYKNLKYIYVNVDNIKDKDIFKGANIDISEIE